MFETWFEHKLNTYYLLSPFKTSMPKHYWYIRNGKYFPIDVVSECNGSIDDIISLVKENPIAAKSTVGGHGVGFYKLEYINDKFYVNFKEKSESEFKELINKLNDYIITEYVVPHKEFQELCGEKAFAVLRIITIYDEKDGPQITGAIVRLGSKAAGVVTDYPGSIYCGINLEDGKMFKPIYRERDDFYVSCPKHPDTGKELEGNVIPNWNELKNLVKQISKYLAVTPYLVMDIIPTEDGFAILEINSHGQVRTVEPFYPFRKNKYNCKIFKTKDR